MLWASVKGDWELAGAREWKHGFKPQPGCLPTGEEGEGAALPFAGQGVATPCLPRGGTIGCASDLSKPPGSSQRNLKN